MNEEIIILNLHNKKILKYWVVERLSSRFFFAERLNIKQDNGLPMVSPPSLTAAVGEGGEQGKKK